MVPLDGWGILFETLGCDLVKVVVGWGSVFPNEEIQVLLEPRRNGGISLGVDVGDPALSFWEGGASSCSPYPQWTRNGLWFLGGLGGSPYPLMRPTGCSSCDVLVTGGDANRAAVAAGVHCGGGGGNLA